MEITLPEHIGEITLQQFQQFDLLRNRTDLDETEFGKRLITIFTELKYKDLGGIKLADYNSMLEQIVKACDLDGTFKQTFELNGIEYGLLPNFDKMNMREWTNLCKWEVNKVENYNRIMAILYRPIKSRDRSGNYTLEKYEGTEAHYLRMLDMPMDIVNGVIVFFYNLANELQIHIQVSTNTLRMKRERQQLGISQNGVGMLQ